MMLAYRKQIVIPVTKYIGILTSGGDSPGLNATIRGVGKSALNKRDMKLIGFRDGFRGLMENRTMRLEAANLSDILTRGGTLLGTSRDKPHRMMVDNKVQDMTDVIVRNYHDNHLDVLVCLGGGGTQKNALRLKDKGLNIITLPKTIDNDIAMTDMTFGFDTALGIATDAIDRLHSTAHSHHRIIVVEIMGHRAGWLALGAGIAGGADVILIPEIPYAVESVAEAIRERVVAVRVSVSSPLPKVRSRCMNMRNWSRIRKRRTAANRKIRKKSKSNLPPRLSTQRRQCASPNNLNF